MPDVKIIIQKRKHNYDTVSSSRYPLRDRIKSKPESPRKMGSLESLKSFSSIHSLKRYQNGEESSLIREMRSNQGIESSENESHSDSEAEFFTHNFRKIEPIEQISELELSSGSGEPERGLQMLKPRRTPQKRGKEDEVNLYERKFEHRRLTRAAHNSPRLMHVENGRSVSKDKEDEREIDEGSKRYNLRDRSRLEKRSQPNNQVNFRLSFHIQTLFLFLGLLTGKIM